jgi:alpha/beta hydrolase fold
MKTLQLQELSGFGSVSGVPELAAGFSDIFTSYQIQLPALALHAVIGGEGPPLLLLGGWPQTWYAWRLVMPALARHHQVIVIEARGFGRSDKPQSGYDTATVAADLVSAMACWGISGLRWQAMTSACGLLMRWPANFRLASHAWP